MVSGLWLTSALEEQESPSALHTGAGAAVGAAIGAAVGAAIGAADGAAIGTVIGATVGAAALPFLILGSLEGSGRLVPLVPLAAAVLETEIKAAMAAVTIESFIFENVAGERRETRAANVRKNWSECLKDNRACVNKNIFVQRLKLSSVEASIREKTGRLPKLA